MSLSRRLASSFSPWLALSPEQLDVRNRVAERMASGVYGTEFVPCFCGSESGQLVAERDRYGLPIKTHLCNHCGILRSSPRLDANATRMFYEDDYRSLYTAVGKEILFDHQAQKGALFAERLMQLPDLETVYEVGCGAGGILKPFADAGLDAVGCDFDQDYLEEGRRRGVDLVYGGVDALLERQEGKQADLIFLIHVVEHFLDLEAELNSILAALKPGGVLCVEVPGVRSIATDYSGDILLYLQNAHNYHFTASTLSFVLATVGLNVLSSDEGVLLLAHKPHDMARQLIAPPSGEAISVLRYLAKVERDFLVSEHAAQAIRQSGATVDDVSDVQR